MTKKGTKNMNIIAGLGNPGIEYQNTRHNAGFLAVDALVKAKGGTWEKSKKFQAEIAKCGETLFMKPLSFMNESGRSVQALLSFYKLLPAKIGFLRTKDAELGAVLTVIHDDLDIALGKWKISTDSRSAGHNGVQSIINKLKTKKFRRIRLGVMGDKPAAMAGRDYVLQKFKDEELALLKLCIANIDIKN